MEERKKNWTGILMFLLFAVAAVVFYYTAKEKGVLQGTPSTGSYAPTGLKTLQDGTYDKLTDTSEVYTLQYPRDFETLSLDHARGGFLGTPRITISFPQDSFQTPKSNYGEAFLTVRIGIDADSIQNCYVSPAESSSPIVAGPTVHGTEFKQTTATDVGAGNIYTSRIYRALKNNRCYEISLTVHTANIGNFDPGTVVEFDKEKAFSQLDTIFKSFTLISKSGPVE